MTNVVKIDIEDTANDNEVIASFNLHELDVEAFCRRLDMVNVVISLEDTNENLKNHYLLCAALACSLRKEDGELLYPEKDGYKEVAKLPHAQVNVLVVVNQQVNPMEPTLAAKKKS